MLRKIAVLALLALLITPVAGHALGLGEIRVTSALNQPLEAEIALTAVRAGELDSLEVRLAAPESFARVGLDRPFILTQLRFEIGQNAQGQPVVKVSTNEPVREPFLNFLVEASWARGRLLREFTVLLDPPVLMPATVTPVRVPEASRPRPVTDRPIESYTAPQSSMPTERWSQASGTYGPVQRAETLWRIAERVRPDGVSINQMMLAILDANPEAFQGNINFLKAGYVLRIPDRSVVGRRSAAEAMAEVSRQNQAWRSGEVADFRVSQAGPAASDSRLRLHAPDATGTGSDPASQAGGTDDSGLRSQLESARQELDDERIAREALAERLVELEGESADLRRRLEIRDSELAAVGDRPVVEAEEPAAPQERPTPTPTPTPTPVAEPEDDGVMGIVANPLVLALLLGVPVIGAIVFFALRRGRESSAAREAMAPIDEPEADDDATQFGDDEATQFAVSTQDEPEPEQYDEPAAMPEPEPEPEPEAPADDDPMTASAIMELDEGDPTSEADFHLAYGLYDQAAELMEGALKQNPGRVPYLVKLLEIYFAWGKTDEFTQHARDGKDTLEAAGEWSNVAIMGRQLAADELLFSASSTTMGTTRSDLDLDFAGGHEGEAENESLDGGTGMFEDDAQEHDLTSAFDAPAQATGAAQPESAAAPAGIEEGLEFDLSDFELPEAEGSSEVALEADQGTMLLDLDALEGNEGLSTDGGTQVYDLETGGLDDGGAEIDLDATLLALDSDSGEDELNLDISDDIDELSLDIEGMLEEDASLSSSDEGASPGSDSRLDLARAYIDMGDSDGARSLLQEVMAEGDEAQKKEAQELLDLL